MTKQTPKYRTSTRAGCSRSGQAKKPRSAFAARYGRSGQGCPWAEPIVRVAIQNKKRERAHEDYNRGFAWPRLATFAEIDHGMGILAGFSLPNCLATAWPLDPDQPTDPTPAKGGPATRPAAVSPSGPAPETGRRPADAQGGGPAAAAERVHPRRRHGRGVRPRRAAGRRGWAGDAHAPWIGGVAGGGRGVGGVWLRNSNGRGTLWAWVN